MKIAFVSTFYPFRGGIAQFNASLYRALETHGEVKAFNFKVQYPKVFFPGKTQLVTEGDSADQIPSDRLMHAMSPATYRKTVKAIQSFQPDLVIISYWMPFMAPALGYISGKLMKETTVVSIVHNALPHERSRMDRLLSNYFFRRNTHIITLSNAVKNDLTPFYKNLKIKTLLHPTYNHFGSPLPKEDACAMLQLNAEKRYVLFFGLVRPYKGLDRLLEALCFLPKELELIIAGETYGSFHLYQQLIDENNLQTRVHHFDHYIPDQEVGRYFSAADLCVLPYKSATQSGITAIAHELDTPVLATHVGGLSEFIQDGVNGVLVDPSCDTKELANAILQSLDPERLNDFRTNIRQHKPPSWGDFAAELMEWVCRVDSKTEC